MRCDHTSQGAIVNERHVFKILKVEMRLMKVSAFTETKDHFQRLASTRVMVF